MAERRLLVVLLWAFEDGKVGVSSDSPFMVELFDAIVHGQGKFWSIYLNSLPVVAFWLVVDVVIYRVSLWRRFYPSIPLTDFKTCHSVTELQRISFHASKPYRRQTQEALFIIPAISISSTYFTVINITMLHPASTVKEVIFMEVWRSVLATITLPICSWVLRNTTFNYFFMGFILGLIKRK